MKPTRQWMFAAILTILCGANLLTSCDKADNSVVITNQNLFINIINY